jgi:hypothetical protein
MAVPSVEFIQVSSSSSTADRDTERVCGQMQSRYAGKRLRAKDIAALPPGVHEDGGGLRLVVEPPRGKQPGARRWVLRVTIAAPQPWPGFLPTGAPGPGPRCRRRYPPSRTRGPRPDYRAPWRADAVGDVRQGPDSPPRTPFRSFYMAMVKRGHDPCRLLWGEAAPGGPISAGGAFLCSVLHRRNTPGSRCRPLDGLGRACR